MSMHRFKQLDDGSILDLTTGEILGGQENRGSFVFIPNRPKLKENWFMFFQNACEKLALDKSLSGESFRVLMYLLSNLDFENYIIIQQVEIAEKLDMKRANVSRAIKQLTDKEILIKGPKLGRTYSYKLNSTYGWKGKVIKLVDQTKEQKPKLVVDNTKKSPTNIQE